MSQLNERRFVMQISTEEKNLLDDFRRLTPELARAAGGIAMDIQNENRLTTEEAAARQDLRAQSALIIEPTRPVLRLVHSRESGNDTPQ